ncbi:hypothetical protein [Staphylospora marina]|uniref:hypothetical protein n=1 Tax=Staphylospora marina TaxID=2490858 RepID=UPI0013DE51EB|nr:hypothetical protein [Staphylospora marina]
MPVLLFQIALVVILIHAVYSAIQSAQGQNWFEFAYRLAVGVAALWFLLQHL